MSLSRSALALWAAAVGLSAAELTPGQWREDVAFLGKELPARHKNLFFKLTPAEWDRQVAELSASVSKLSDGEIRLSIVRLLALAGDAHTSAGFESDRYFYLGFREFPEGLYIIDTIRDYAAATGARVVSIDGMQVEEVRRRVYPFFGIENEAMKLSFLPRWLSMAAALQFAGVIRSPDEAVFVFEKDGRTFPLTVRTLPPTQRMATGERPDRVAAPSPRPLWLRRRDDRYWWEYLPESKAVFLQYNSCTDMKSLPFQQFTEEIVAHAGRERPDRLVIDLRHNGGGDSEVSNPLLRALKAKRLRPKQGVDVLIGPYTFSSGMMVALRLKRLGATLLGEPTGQKPNCYGDVRVFRLPHSGIGIRYSTKHFTQMKGDPPSLMPDRLVPFTAADYFAGRDPVLEAALSPAKTYR